MFHKKTAYQIVWIDYDEMLKIYIEYMVHPSARPYWQSDFNYSFFMNNILL